MSQKNLPAHHRTQANDTRSFCPSLLSDTATISVHSETDGTPSSIPVHPLPRPASTAQTMPSDSTPALLLPCMPSCFPNPLPASSSHPHFHEDKFRFHREWFLRSAMGDLLGEDYSLAQKDKPNRFLDLLLKHR